MHKRTGVVLAVTALLLLCPAQAEAHLVTTGLGPVYDGIGHYFLSPGDVLSTVALALLAGLRGPTVGRQALWMLPVVWLLGGLGGLMITDWAGVPEQLVGALSLLLLGVLVAADLALPVTVVAGLAALVGGAHGFLNGLAMCEAGVGQGGRELLGVAVTLFVLTTFVSAAAVAARPVWARIVVRVAGSWIAASGLLWAGWTLRGIK